MTNLRRGAALLCALTAGAVAAHPVHEVVQNAYLTLAGGALGLELELTAGPQVVDKVLATLDGNQDGHVSHAEAAAYAVGVLRASRLVVDGRQVKWRPVSISVPGYAALRGAHGTIVIYARAGLSGGPPPVLLVYRNDYRPAESRCDANIFLKPAVGDHYSVLRQDRSQDGRVLSVRLGVQKARRSDRRA